MPGWGPHLEIGIPEIDAQHRDLVEAAVDVVAALSSAGTAASSRLLDVLAQHVLVHFETEERWMRETGYPRLREHVARHDQLVTRLVALSRDQAHGGAPRVLALRVRNVLSWLEDHTEDEDRKLAQHLAARGGPGPRAGAGAGAASAQPAAGQSAGTNTSSSPDQRQAAPPRTLGGSVSV